MRLLVGDPGSGKTTLVLEEVERKLRRGDTAFRLIVPTATMADHLAHELARSGLLVPPRCITTLAGWLQSIVPDCRVISGADLALLIRQILRRLRLPAFADAEEMPGLAPALGAAIEELSQSGCTSLTWHAVGSYGLWTGPVLQALGDVYEAVEQELAQRGYELRSGLLSQAAAQLRQGATQGVRSLYFDGFFTFSRAELELLKAARQQTGVNVTLPEWPGGVEALRELRMMGLREQRCTARHAVVLPVFCPGSTMQREVEEVGRRIRQLTADGLSFGDIGVIVRAAEPYVELLRTTFHRFGIPVRSYFAKPLGTHPVAEFFASLLDAIQNDWDHLILAGALRSPVSQAGADPSMDQFIFAVQETLPAQGLAAMKETAREAGAGPAIRGMIASLRACESWNRDQVEPSEWASRFRHFSHLLALPPEQPAATTQEASAWRLRAEASSAWFAAVEHAAALLPPDPLPLATFWREIRSAVEGAALREPHPARNAVALMDVYEARQWKLPAIFLCGLIEGEFPRHPKPQPLLDEDLRFRLKQNGIPVRTQQELEDEEQFLFRFAQTRATRELRMSWRRFNAKGEEELRAFALDRMTASEAAPVPVRIQPARPSAPLTPPDLGDLQSIRALEQKHPRYSVTGLESFLQCPFQFYVRSTLKLKAPPGLPEERLDPILTGSILHDALKDWHEMGGNLESIFAVVWQKAMTEHRIPASFRAELTRWILLRGLRRYEEDAEREPGWQTLAEKAFTLQVEDATIRGRIDRYDVNAHQQARLYEFKFTGIQGLKRRKEKQEAGLLVQPGIYMAALQQQGLQPVSFHYVAVKGRVESRGWDEPEELEAQIQIAKEQAAEAHRRIRAGHIAVRPADPEGCRWCEVRDLCRIQSIAVESTAESAS